MSGNNKNCKKGFMNEAEIKENLRTSEIGNFGAQGSAVVQCEMHQKNYEGASGNSTNNPDATETEDDYFSLLHKNHHGSIDLGLDEKLNGMTGSYSEILDDGDETPQVEDPGANVCAYLKELEDKRKAEFDVKEVQRGTAQVYGKTAENLVQPDDALSSLTTDFMERNSISNQQPKRKDCVLRNMNVVQNIPRGVIYPPVPPFDPCIISDLEDQARNIATSMDTLIENLTGTLHSISSLTVECVETYRDAVCKTCDAVDSNIKSMYQLMAKCEELSKSMKPVYKLHDQIKEIRRLLDLFEGVVFSGGT